jgi:SAM-dependent methyltransferase
MTNSTSAAKAGTVDGARRSDSISLPVIAPTIIPGVNDTFDLSSFYERSYSQDPGRSAMGSRWRALGAVGKADHVTGLCRRASLTPGSVLDVGCGDGALLSELHSRGFGVTLAGVEITQAAVDIASQRQEISQVALYDGRHLPYERGSFDLGILSHVLEHVPEPVELLREVSRACRAVICEVPLEANWSARRADRRAVAEEVGHLQRLSRADARGIVAAAGLRVAAELEDPLPAVVHRFFATGAGRRAAGTAKWALRSSAHRLAPARARRAFTRHYACRAVAQDA